MRVHRLAVVLALAIGTYGCSTHRIATHDTTATPPATTRTTITTAPRLPAAFDGTIDQFYDPPKPLPPAQPGTLIRYQNVAETPTEVTWRILYHSIDAAGRDQATPGTVTFPKGPAPKGGWPVVSNAPGTVGLNTACALSRIYARPDAFGVEGVAVRTDYIGMVKGQLQRYLSGTSEAHSVIDAVRAARNIPAAHAGRRWVAFGHSQGGHAALFTNELAHTYAPELDLVGTVVGAPASQSTNLFAPAVGVVPHIVELMALFGIAEDHPGVDSMRYLTPSAKKLVPILRTDCLGEIIPAFAPIAAHGLFTKDPLTTEPAASMMRENEPGTSKAPSPILLFEGTEDGYVLPASVEDIRRRLCAVGQTTKYLLIPGADHGTEIDMVRPQIQSWIADRFAEKPAPDNCPDGT